MFFTKEEKNDKLNLLKTYLLEQDYDQVNSALTHYSLAMAKLTGYCFKANEDIISAIIKIIVDYGGTMKFSEQFTFAENLFIDMDVDFSDNNEVAYYLDNLRVCLSNPLIIQSFNKIKPLYILFENKRIVQGIISELKEENIDVIIDYIMEARQYYVDESALASAALSLSKKLDDKAAVLKQLASDRQNAGVYNIDYYRLEELERRLLGVSKQVKKDVKSVVVEETKEIDKLLTKLKKERVSLKDKIMAIVDNNKHIGNKEIISGRIIGYAILSSKEAFEVILTTGGLHYGKLVNFSEVSNVYNRIFEMTFWDTFALALQKKFPNELPANIDSIIGTILDDFVKERDEARKMAYQDNNKVLKLK